MANLLEVNESPLQMYIGETVAYSLTTTKWVSSPTVDSGDALTLYDPEENDVSGTELSGTNTVSGDVITTKLITPSKVGTYRGVVTFTKTGATYLASFFIKVSNPADFA